MLDVLLTSSVSFIVTFLAIPVILQIAELKKLYDLPDERKIHTRPVASLGGVGIFGGFLLAALLSVSAYTNPEFQYFFAAAIVIFFLGLKDDILVLSATKKFIGQMIAAAILIHLGGIRITSMHGLLGFTELPEAFGFALSYLTIIVVINSFNLIDGVDGLAATLGLLSLAVFGTYFFIVGMQAYALFAFSLAGSLIAFLIFNHHPAKIFMGDSGSLLIGLVNSILVIKFITVADSANVSFPVESAVAVGFAILIVPLLDTFRVFSIRIFGRRSPFTPDRNHVHHLLLEKGLNHKNVTLCCVFINILFITIAYLGRSLGPTSLILIMVSISFTGFGFLYYRKSKRKLVIASHLNGIANGEFKSSPKVVSLTKETAAVEQQ